MISCRSGATALITVWMRTKIDCSLDCFKLIDFLFLFILIVNFQFGSVQRTKPANCQFLTLYSFKSISPSEIPTNSTHCYRLNQSSSRLYYIPTCYNVIRAKHNLTNRTDGLSSWPWSLTVWPWHFASFWQVVLWADNTPDTTTILLLWGFV